MKATRQPLNGTLQTILVVGNNPVILPLVLSILEGANFRVLSAASATDAIKLAKQSNDTIDLLLSETDMPDMSGVTLAAALRKNRPDTRVMLMSSGDSGLLVLSYGWTYIEKESGFEQLIELVNNVLHSKDLSQGLDRFDTRKGSASGAFHAGGSV